jgi:hypothetical protein
MLQDLGAQDGRKLTVSEREVLDVPLQNALVREPLPDERHVPGVEVDAHTPGGEGGEIEPRTTARIEHRRLGPALPQQPADRASSVAMEDRLEATPVISDVDPVVRFDVPVIVADPFGPFALRLEGVAIGVGVGVGVIVHEARP